METNPPPIAIGGVGGSGTRTIATIVKEAGYYIGSDLNDANDNLWFSLLFVDPRVWRLADSDFAHLASIFKAVMSGERTLSARELSIAEEMAIEARTQHDVAWLRKRVASLAHHAANSAHHIRWGWKAPNTHMFIDRLRCHIKNLKYIHLARNGLDMALSKNQNQLRIWGDAILGSNCTVSPTHSLQFWCWAQKRILRIGKEFGDDFLFIKFEDLCEYPDRTVTRVLDFINIEPTTREVERLANLIAAPPSIGRHQTVNIQQFNPQDVEYVRSLGFRVQL